MRIGLECGQLDIDGTEVGSRLGVVVDPMDSNHVVAAEQPDDWNDPMVDVTLGAALISVFVLYAAAVVGGFSSSRGFVNRGRTFEACDRRRRL